MSLIDSLLGQTDTMAAQATNTALDQAAARPFNVVLSVDQNTQLWAAALVLVVAVLLRRMK